MSTWTERITGLPLNEDGWTILEPSADSRLIYVSNDGNDATAQHYSPSDAAIGDDPRNPVGTVNAYATIAAARDQQRSGYPDWILFRCGDEWSTLFWDGRSGRQEGEPSVLTYYGDPALGLPAMRGTSSNSTWATFNNLQDVAVIGISFYLRRITIGGTNRPIIEGCIFERVDQPLGVMYGTRRAAIRRNAFFDSLHGIFYTEDVLAFLIEDNLIDNNGRLDSSQSPLTDENVEPGFLDPRTDPWTDYWEDNGWIDWDNPPSPMPIMWHTVRSHVTNPVSYEVGDVVHWEGKLYTCIKDHDARRGGTHNHYIQNTGQGIIYRNNIASRPCYTTAIRPSGLIEHNLFVDAILQLGRTQARPYQGIIHQNVITGGRNYNTGWNPGINYRWPIDSTIQDNIIYNRRIGSGIAIDLEGPYRSNRVLNNIIYNWGIPSGSGSGILRTGTTDNTSDWSDTEIKDNVVLQVNGGTITSGISANADVTDNVGYSITNNVTASGWTNLTELPSPDMYPDPERNIQTYMEDVIEDVPEGGYVNLDQAQQRFYELRSQMHRGNWDERLTAKAVVNYIREGFDRSPVEDVDVVMVPHVIGQEAATGIATLEASGLTTTVVYEYSETVDEGLIISTLVGNPYNAEYTFQEEGELITVTVSGEDPAPVEDYDMSVYRMVTAPTGQNVYAKITNLDTAEVFNIVDSPLGFEAYNPANVDAYAVLSDPEHGASGTYPWRMPEEVPAGTYDLEFRYNDSSPFLAAESDTYADAGVVVWDGDAFVIGTGGGDAADAEAIATAVWGAATRTLSAFAFAVETDSASRTASQADVSTLEGRLTAARAGYLDHLNTLTEDSDGLRFTEKALEAAPAGEGGGDSAWSAAQRDKVLADAAAARTAAESTDGKLVLEGSFREVRTLEIPWRTTTDTRDPGEGE